LGKSSNSGVWKVGFHFYVGGHDIIMVILTSGVNFINVLHTAFTLVDPISVKNTVKSSVSFYTFGISSVKAVHRTLMKLSPGHRE